MHGNSRRGLALYLVMLLVSLLPLASPAQAQVETSSRISGTVTDATGAVVAGAAVTARNQTTGAIWNTTTNQVGFYSFLIVPPGTYTVTVTMGGFKTAIVTDRLAQVAQPALVDVTLSIGSSTQKITVTAGGAELLSTSTGEISGNITPTLVENLPLNGHDFFDLAVLTPGTTPQYLSLSQISFSQQSLIYVQAANTFVASGVFAAGNRDSGANVSIDGSNVQSPVYQQTTQLQSTASVQEMRIETSSMNAEFGSGVSAVNVVTKSGSNTFHGEAYEYLRNNHLDAADFFTNLGGFKLPNYQQNQFGAAVGGPIKKDKLLFFGNYEGLRVRQGTEQYEQVPPNDLRNGDFSNYLPPLPNGGFGPRPTIYNPYQYDPTTGLRVPFPNNQIPLGQTTLCAPRPACVDPATLAYLQKYVLPANTALNGIPMLAGVQRSSISSNQETARLDWNKSSSAHIYGRYTKSTRPSLAGGIQPLEGTANGTSAQNAVLHWTETLKATTVNDFSVSYSRPKWLLGRNFSVPDVNKQIGIANTSSLAGGPNWDVLGYSLGDSTQYLLDNTDNTYEFKDDVSTVKGRHNMKAGIDITERRYYYPDVFNDKGAFTFRDVYSAACPYGNTSCANALKASGLDSGGLSFADYLLGTQNYDLLTLSGAHQRAYQRYVGVYAQDSWRATSKLTVNYGFRYEYWPPWLVPRNTVADFDRTTGTIQYVLQNPLDYLDPAKCYGECAPLNPKVPDREGYRTSKKDFAPRLALAYLLTPNTTLRASFGVFFDGNNNNNQFSNLQHGIAPFNLRLEEFATGAEQVPPLHVTGEFPPAGPTAIPQPNANPPASMRVPELYYPTPKVLEWSFSLQQRLSSQWGMELDYLGSHTIHEFEYLDENAAALPVGPLANLSLQQRRPYPQWGSIGIWAPVGWARYNGFVASVKNTGWHGLTLLSNFSWMKGIISDDPGRSDLGNSNFRSPYTNAGMNPQIPLLRYIAGYTYQLPLGRGKAFGNSLTPVLDKFVSGWAFSGITEFSTGSPQPVIADDLSGTALSSYGYPNRICNPNTNVPGGKNRFHWFNTACFVDAPYGTYGNSTLGAFMEPGINNWSLSIDKTTPTRFPKETGRIDFRADFFNAFNHTQWGPPDGYLPDGPAFGEIFSTRPARQIQFTLKYIF
jgi:carboxypeptidase family protein